MSSGFPEMSLRYLTNYRNNYQKLHEWVARICDGEGCTSTVIFKPAVQSSLNVKSNLQVNSSRQLANSFQFDCNLRVDSSPRQHEHFHASLGLAHCIVLSRLLQSVLNKILD
jgi:hypothetical protein